MSKKRGLCPRCHEARILEKHHVAPRRFFGNKDNCHLYLCSKCHESIEEILPEKNMLCREDYHDITVQWLQGKTPMIFIQTEGESNGTSKEM